MSHTKRYWTEDLRCLEQNYKRCHRLSKFLTLTLFSEHVSLCCHTPIRCRNLCLAWKVKMNIRETLRFVRSQLSLLTGNHLMSELTWWYCHWSAAPVLCAQVSSNQTRFSSEECSFLCSRWKVLQQNNKHDIFAFQLFLVCLQLAKFYQLVYSVILSRRIKLLHHDLLKFRPLVTQFCIYFFIFFYLFIFLFIFFSCVMFTRLSGSFFPSTKCTGKSRTELNQSKEKWQRNIFFLLTLRGGLSALSSWRWRFNRITSGNFPPCKFTSFLNKISLKFQALTLKNSTSTHHLSPVKWEAKNMTKGCAKQIKALVGNSWPFKTCFALGKAFQRKISSLW